MRRVLQTLAVLAGLGLLGGGATVFFGLYNVSAKAGHLPGVSWLLHTTFRNSVHLRAPPAGEVPDLSAPGLVALGAQHFDAACRSCHAAPGGTRSATVRAMTPEPPPIAEAVAQWRPRHLHWIVHEGVKMSGMPGWPANRGDDVWPVVAFLAAVPGMTGAEYARLTATPDVGDNPLLAYCAGCHGAEGRSGGPQIPRLDIQSEIYLAGALEAYLEGRRDSGIMAQAVSTVGAESLRRLARHYAAAEPEGEGAEAPAELVARGRALARARPGDRDVPACAACHGPEASEATRAFPALAGQYAPYLIAQLRLWRAGGRGGGKRAELMSKSAQDLTEADIEALAAYYASLPPSELDAGKAEPASEE